eukprot:INCI7246.2.p1 GENE.INCI7246.2~~INCI7246.2.p1  ORF type:complete len:500 (+),score=118.62 INCI7246.2:22-1500(+)
MAKTMTSWEFRQEMRIDLEKDLGIVISLPPANKRGYHALDYENLGAPPEVEEDSGDQPDPTKASSKGEKAAAAAAATAPAAKKPSKHGEYEQQLNHCGYDATDDFVDDDEQIEAAQQIVDASRVVTVLRGFHVNRGRIETKGLLPSANSAASDKSRRKRRQSGVQLSEKERSTLMASIAKKAHTLVREKKKQKDTTAAMLKVIPRQLDKLLFKLDSGVRIGSSGEKISRPAGFLKDLHVALPDEWTMNGLVARLKSLELQDVFNKLGKEKDKIVNNFKKWASKTWPGGKLPKGTKLTDDQELRFLKCVRGVLDCNNEQLNARAEIPTAFYKTNLEAMSNQKMKTEVLSKLQPHFPLSLQRLRRKFSSIERAHGIKRKARGVKSGSASSPAVKRKKTVAGGDDDNDDDNDDDDGGGDDDDDREGGGYDGDNNNVEDGGIAKVSEVVDLTATQTSAPRYLPGSADGLIPPRGWDFAVGFPMAEEDFLPVEAAPS